MFLMRSCLVTWKRSTESRKFELLDTNLFRKVSRYRSVHDLRAWSLSHDFHALTAHIVIKDIKFYRKVLDEATELARSKYKLHQVTLQIEV